MESIQSPKKARAPPRSRKSIAHLPSPPVNIEKENTTINLAVTSTLDARAKLAAKKPRSKSIGPGGLDALKEDSGNRRQVQSALPPFVKSILKPTAPISPPRRSSPRNNGRNLSPKKSLPDKTQSTSASEVAVWKSSNPPVGIGRLPNPFEGSSESIISNLGLISPSQHRTRVVVRSEEEQQAAAKERERQELLAHREARRKSLANRRVSFAPEATLHTWNVVELPEDSTVSSASTNLTRRASALSAIAASPFPPQSPTPNSDASEPPSTPPAQVEEVQIGASPSHQRDLHQKKYRRGSVIPPMNFNNPDDFSSSPCSGGSDNENDDETQASMTAEEENDDSNSDDNDSVEGESTIIGADAGDSTSHSHGDSSTGSSVRLEEALRLAARQAGTQGIEYDENGDISMEMADDENTSAFQPWKKESNHVLPVTDTSTGYQQQDINPFSPAFGANITEAAPTDDAGKTMEFTRSMGTILTDTHQLQSLSNDSGQVGTSVRRSSGGGRCRSSGDSSVFGDETMDLTTAIGAIQQNQLVPSMMQPVQDSDSGDEDEELTMEFTSAVGGLLGQFSKGREADETLDRKQASSRHLFKEESPHDSAGSFYAKAEMDITMTAGSILPSITERTEPPEDHTLDMDITTAIGAILPQQLSIINRNEAKLIMERETETGQPSFSPFYGNLPVNPRLSAHTATIASETGSPSLTSSNRRSNAKKSFPQRESTTPKSTSRQSSPTKKMITPIKQRVPTLLGPTTPGKTLPSGNMTKRTISPKKLFKPETEKSPASREIQSAQLFTKDAHSGEATPSIVLKPRLRRSSGLGVDKPGLGSPRVTALLDRRRSIGEDAKAFTLQDQASKSVAFKSPQTVEAGLERQYAEDERCKSERGASTMDIHCKYLEEENDSTANLKDLIESLTPRKKKLNGRKSLHVGAAKGLLGKRPVELDEDEDDDSTPKRLKGREGSPVKKIRLPAPPTKIQTTGRLTRSARRSLEGAASNNNIGTPQSVKASGKHLQKEEQNPRHAENLFGRKNLLDLSQEEAEMQGKDAVGSKQVSNRVHLQDFLNMTSIRFIELTTTKRRLTVAPNLLSDNTHDDPSGPENKALVNKKGSELEQCVVAGACTIPMLELYQHSCRELKKYIAEGRSIVREIEADTHEENPPLFREYITASAETKSIMDDQFKNVKTHARLLSKAMWYEWRMKLLDGLKEGLVKVADEMNVDDNLLLQQHKVLEPNLPSLVHQHDQLEAENKALQVRADELTKYDQEELNDARVELLQIEQEIDAERKLVEDLQYKLRCKEDGIEHAIDHRHHCLEQIEEAEKVRLESRGWSPSEVASLRARVKALEKAHNWSIASANGTSLTMTYRRTLELYFTPASFMRNRATAAPTINTSDSPISLTFVGDAQEYDPQPLSTEKRFFLQIMRAHLQCLPQATTKVKDLLKFISRNWETACRIGEETRILGISYITEPTILSDEVLAIKVVLLLRAMKTKVHIRFEVKVQTHQKAIELDVSVQSTANVFYGEELKEKKMAEFLEQKISVLEKPGITDGGVWARAVLELQERLIARGKK